MKRLDEIEARARKAALMIDIGPTSEKEWAACAAACNDVPALMAALRAVLEMHAEMSYGCAVCEEQDQALDWPCPTVAAIRQHLGEDA